MSQVRGRYHAAYLSIPTLLLTSYLTPYILGQVLGLASYYLIPSLTYLLLIFIILRYVSIAVKIRGIYVALLCAMTYLTMYLPLGLISGFGLSPYTLGLTSIINIVYTVLQTLGIELSRYATIRLLKRKSESLALIIPSIVFALIYVSPARIISASLDIDYFKWFSSIMLPLLARSALASFICFNSGPIASFTYVATLELSKKLLPVLPNLKWYVLGFVGTTSALIGFIIAAYAYLSTKLEPKFKLGSSGSSGVLRHLIFTAVVVMLVLIPIGVLGIKPLIIVSGSMRPFLDVGDVVLLASVSLGGVKDIHVGDVIGYVSETGDIVVHRVIKIVKEDGKIFFVTKGDANREPDRKLVTPEMIVGKYVTHIPKIGWLGIIAKKLISMIMGAG